MQRSIAPAISPSEWRWVIIFSGLLVAVTLLPYAWAFASDAPNDFWQFMGILPNPLDGATYVAKIGEGARGDWLFTLNYTPTTDPNANSGAAINEYYLFLGHVARLTGLSWLLMYHIARLAMGFIMYVSLYYLGAVIWPRLRPRRLFFSLLAVGSGLGWLYLVFAARPTGVLNPDALPTDFSIPESIPFFSTYVNPHFPLAIALLALLASTFVMVFRPGFDMQPGFANGGVSVAILSALLSIVQPQALVAISLALAVYLLILTWRIRRLPMMELNWVILVIFPAVPFFIYYQAITQQNPAMRIWNQQNVTPSPSPIFYVLGFGLILLIAIPGILRAIRYFERDGDRFMIIWLIVNALLLYAPFNLQRRLSIGLIIPITYFAVRALEDYWFHRVQPPWRDAALVALFVFIVPSNILSLLIPLFGVVNPDQGIQHYQLVYANEAEAVRWIGHIARPGEVVLASPRLSLWIPANTPLRVVYGHPYETLNAGQKLNDVGNWFAGTDCETALKYNVAYIIDNTVDHEGTPAACTKNLGEPLVRFASVSVYALR